MTGTLYFICNKNEIVFYMGLLLLIFIVKLNITKDECCAVEEEKCYRYFLSYLILPQKGSGIVQQGGNTHRRKVRLCMLVQDWSGLQYMALLSSQQRISPCPQQ